jgi:hypothetical protein
MNVPEIKLVEPQDWRTVDELLSKWRETIGAIQNAHYQSSTQYARYNLWLGVPVIVITIVVGSAVFATLQNQVENWAKIALGFISVVAAVLSGLQTFLRYGERAERHRSGGVRFGALLRKVDYMRSLPFESRDNAKEFMNSVKSEWDTLMEDLPMPSQRAFKKESQGIVGKKVE